MSTVEFDEEKSISDFTSRKIFGEPVEPWTARFLRKIGIVKTNNQAKYVMLGVVVICFGLAFYIFFRIAFPS